jgi:hypothetical protein
LAGGKAGERFGDGGPEFVAGSGFGLAEQGLQLGEGFFD